MFFSVNIYTRHKDTVDAFEILEPSLASLRSAPDGVAGDVGTAAA